MFKSFCPRAYSKFFLETTVLASQNFLYVLSVYVARSLSVGVAVRYVLPVLRICARPRNADASTTRTRQVAASEATLLPCLVL